MATARAEYIIEKAEYLIDRWGDTGTFHVPQSKSYSPKSGQQHTVTTDVDARLTPPFSNEDSLVPREVYQSGDAIVILSARNITFTPVTGMRLTYKGANWVIQYVSPIGIEEAIAAYTLLLRK